MARVWRLEVLFVMLLGLLVPSMGVAGSNRDKARPSFMKGIGCFDRKDYDCALAAYREAYAIFPSPRISMNIALTLEAKGDAPGAAAHYERFLMEAKQKKGKKGPARQLNMTVTKKLQALREKLGSLTLSCSVEGAEVLLNGESRGRTPMEHRLYVKPGKYPLKLRKKGQGSWHKGLVIAAGQHLKVAVPQGALAKVVVNEPAPTALSRTPRAGTPIYKRWWFWTAIGAGALVVAGGVTAGVLANQGPPDPELGGITFD